MEKWICGICEDASGDCNCEEIMDGINWENIDWDEDNGEWIHNPEMGSR